MIDKIELFKIGETYFKFDFEYSETNKARIKEVYLKQINFTSQEYFKNNELYKISIEFEKGSFKTRIVIWGTALYMGIATYGSFRAGVNQTVKDVRDFSEYVIQITDNDPTINFNDIIRVEKRTGFPGRLKELYNKINHFEKNIPYMSNDAIQIELRNIKQEISNLIQLLSDQDRLEFINDLGNNYTQDLPQPNEKRTTYLINRYGLKPDEETDFIEE